MFSKEGLPNRRAGDRATLTIRDAEFPFRFCPPGRFEMGSPETEEGRVANERRRRVVLTREFWILETLVTQEMWVAIEGDNPSEHVFARNPVERVSWYDSQRFVDDLNALEVAPRGYEFSLPTEAQGEYAFRAGSASAFFCGNALNSSLANIDARASGGAYLGRPTPVDTYAANAWGLRDVCGNVWEWRSDWYGDYSLDEVVDPIGPSFGDFKVLRGGSWHSVPFRCRSAFRHKDPPTHRHAYLGFRIVLRAR